MATTIYVIEPDPDERTWIQSALAPIADAVAFIEDGAALLARLPIGEDACLVTSAEADGASALKLVRELRARGAMIPVIVLGPHSAFRTAVDIARLPATDFLERPVSVRQVRAAVRRACHGVK
jgi:DNA-binding NtrC family response regulator